MEGAELESFRLNIESGFRSETGEFPVVSVNPQFPIDQNATRINSPFGSQNMLFAELAGGGEKVLRLMEIGGKIEACLQTVPAMRRLLEYYEYNKEEYFWKFFEDQINQKRPSKIYPGSMHGAVHNVWSNWIMNYLAGLSEPTAVLEAGSKLSTWHIEGLYNSEYCFILKRKVDDGTSQEQTRQVIKAAISLMNAAPAWKVGYLRNHIDDEAKLQSLTLLQDEFDRLRDVYQNLFEATCAILWPIVLMRNTVLNGSPHDFSGVIYEKPNESKQYNVSSLSQFDKLPNAFKIAVISKFPNMGGCMSLLNSHTRNAIGHASAHHDLFSGKIINGKGEQKPYFDFVGEVFSLVGPLSLAVTCSRFVNVAGRDETLPEIREAADNKSDTLS